MTNHRIRVLSSACFVLSTALALAPAAAAEKREAEFWVGQYVPDPAALDSDIAFGVRGMMPISKRGAFGFDVGYVSTEGEARSGGTTGRLEWSSVFFDFVGDISLAPGKKVDPVFTFGAGVSFGSADVSISGPLAGVSAEELDDVSITLQGGFGVKIDLGKTMYLRPAARVRWFENRSDEDLDTEYLIGLGWRY